MIINVWSVMLPYKISDLRVCSFVFYTNSKNNIQKNFFLLFFKNRTPVKDLGSFFSPNISNGYPKKKEIFTVFFLTDYSSKNKLN